jgi:hypothetical protein
VTANKRLWRARTRYKRVLCLAHRRVADCGVELVVWAFPALVGARIHSEAHHSNRYVVIRNRADLETWLNGFASAQALSNDGASAE